MYKTIQLTREVLYEQVWSKPIRQIAKSFGLSDVGLAKVCRRHDIPRPPVGYWAKIEAGKTVTKIALPESLKLHEEVIQFYLPEVDVEEKDQNRPYFSSKIAAAIKAIKDGGEISIPTKLVNPHPLVAKTEKYFRGWYRAGWRSKCERGHYESPHEVCGLLWLDVSEQQFDRSLLIIDSLAPLSAKKFESVCS